MGKCVRIRSSSGKHPSPPPAYLTLRSGRRVPAAAAAACSPPGRRHRRRGSPSYRCGGAAKRVACGSPGRRKNAERRQLAGGGRRPEEAAAELPSSEATSPVALDVDGDRGDISEPANAALSGDVVKVKKHEHGSKGGVEGRAPSPLLEAEMEAFFAAAELAERRRFAEAYNYDVALDIPLEGRFEWAPVRT